MTKYEMAKEISKKDYHNVAVIWWDKMSKKEVIIEFEKYYKNEKK